jgi:hypothetical protein
MRKYRPLESKTPCENCRIVCFFEGETTRACKDYKEFEVKDSLFKKLLKFIGVG